MAKVRKYFCCTDNLTGCKIIGGVQIALYAISLIISIVALTAINADDAYAIAAIIVVVVILSLAILCAIFLVVAAVMRNATMLMVWVVVNGIGIVLSLLGLFGGGGIIVIIQNLASIAFGIWAELIAIGARQEVQQSTGRVLAGPGIA